MMLQKTLILLFVVLCFSARAQYTGRGRCEVLRIEDERRFEEWLHARRAHVVARSAAGVYKIPVVVHILHSGEPTGQGLNFPQERVLAQIRTLNEDFRRKMGTPGFNNHPDGNDSRIEFVLARVDPGGNPTDGIVRVDVTQISLPPEPRDLIQLCAAYSYWDPERYLNIWTLGGDKPSPLLGLARFPLSGLDGLPDTEYDADGVWVDAYAFGHGDSNNYPDYDMGRTLTHEMGHFLGLLHTWGSVGNSRQCDAYTDYCADTPPLAVATSGCPDTKPVACDGRPAMIENYMDGAYDRCMNIFTKDQIARMHIVLNNSPRRKSLVTSPVIDRSEEVTGIDDDPALAVRLHPNPVTDVLYVSVDESLVGTNLRITAYTPLGSELFKGSFVYTKPAIAIPLREMLTLREKMIVISIETRRASVRRLVMIR